MNLKRWRFRFSLRTLLLCTLLAGSAGLLWQVWPAWGLALEIEEPGPIHEIHISPDDHYFCVCIALKTATGYTSEIRQREIASGRLIRTFPGREEYWQTFLCYTGKYIGQWTSHPNTPDVCALYRSDTGERLPLAETLKTPFYIDTVSRSDNYMVLVTDEGKKCAVLVQLPSCKQLMKLETGVSKLSANGKWIAVRSGRTVTLTALPDMTKGPVWELPSTVKAMDFSPDEKRLAVAYTFGDGDKNKQNNPTGSTRIFDIAQGISTDYSGQLQYPEAFSPSGKWFKTYSDSKTHLWNLEDTNGSVTIMGGDANCFSKDEQRIHADYDLRMWDTRTGMLLWDKQPGFFSTYSPDGNYAAKIPNFLIGSEPVTIVKGTSGERVFEFESLPGGFERVEFAYNQPLIISGAMASNSVESRPTEWSRTWKMWRRWHPEDSFGIAWRFEFWLVVIMFGIVAWSFKRDWRDLAATLS